MKKYRYTAPEAYNRFLYKTSSREALEGGKNMIEEAKMAGSYVKWQITRLCESQNDPQCGQNWQTAQGYRKSPGVCPNSDMTLAQLPELFLARRPPHAANGLYISR